jgi:hypothetical protein
LCLRRPGIELAVGNGKGVEEITVMTLPGLNLSAKALRERVGNMDQLAAVKVVQLDDGFGRPARYANVYTGSGLQYSVALDRGIDIASASFKGMPMGWRGVSGDVAPQYYEAEGIRWLRSYFGGLMTTCGLTNVGAPLPDSPESGEGLHGRIGNTPAHDVAVFQGWEGKHYVLRVSGACRQATTFGENLLLRRTVTTALGASFFEVEDEITNEGCRKTPFTLLYHCNVGWPAVEEGSRVLTPSKSITARDSDAEDGLKDWGRLHGPKAGYAEKVYFHEMKPGRDGTVTVAIVNKALQEGDGFGVAIHYEQENLPRFTQWKMLGQQEYVVGLEPCNCGVAGRLADEAEGRLQYLKPGESRRTRLRFEALTTALDFARIVKLVGKVTPRLNKHT